MTRIAAEAADRWPLARPHRHPSPRPHPARREYRPGGRRVVAPEAAFAAADFLMDFLKTRAPFWKKEHVADADGQAEWVAAKADDDQAVKRWSSPD